MINIELHSINDPSKQNMSLLKKMEIPVDFSMASVQITKNSVLNEAKKQQEVSQPQQADTNYSVDLKSNDNANIVINYNHNALQPLKSALQFQSFEKVVAASSEQHSQEVKLIANLQGPIESKFGSKQLPNQCYIEINMKGMPLAKGKNNAESDIFKRTSLDLKYNLKSILEQLIQTTSYPRLLLTFNLYVVASPNPLYSGDLHLFSACLNASIVMMNLAGINQKRAPFAAMTFLISKNGEEYFITRDLQKAQEEQSKSKRSFMIVDLVSDKDLNILHLESQPFIGSDDNMFDMMDALDDHAVQQYINEIAKTQISINYIL